MEAQLLHIQSADHKEWRCAGCIPLSPTHIDSAVKNICEAAYLPGVLQVLSQTLPVGGPCFGWRLHSVGRRYTGADDTWEAVVLVVREKGSIDTRSVANDSGRSEKTVKEWDILDVTQ